MVAAAALPGSEVVISGVGLNPTRMGIIDVLSAWGRHPCRDSRVGRRRFDEP
jgi:hypothetical protein